MTSTRDEGLISRLRSVEAVMTYEAADRIEQLNADIDTALTTADKAADLMLQMDDRRLEAEAKLAKAVGILVALSNMKTSGNLTATTMAWNAREVLKELEKPE